MATWMRALCLHAARAANEKGHTMKMILAIAILGLAACGGTDNQTATPSRVEGEFLISVASFPAFEAQSQAPACDTSTHALKRTGTMLLNADGTGTASLCRRCFTINDPGTLACDLTGAVAFTVNGSDVHLTITPARGPAINLQARHAGDWIETEGAAVDQFASFRCVNDDCTALLKQIQ